MAEALGAGIINAGLMEPSGLCFADLRNNRLRELADRYGVQTASSNREVLNLVGTVILAVKPGVVPVVLAELREVWQPGQLVISIAAGVPLSLVESYLPEGQPAIRVMPNTPALVGAGAAAMALGRATTSADEQWAGAILGSVGRWTTLDENHLDAVTGLSGSGPAYVFMLLEGLIDGGVRMGLPRDAATLLATQTVMGAARMVLETGKHPAQLKDAVTTPGGTTIAGLEALEKSAFRGALIGAVRAATERSRELSGNCSK